MKKIHWIILIATFGLGYFLRVMWLPRNVLTFGYDQARDALVSQQILGGDIKIQGPPASTPGLYHGVFYYYLLAPAYAFGQNPINAAYWIAFLNVGTVFIVFVLGYLMTKKVWVGILSAFLFAISFEATQYATWLSNPTIGVWTVPLIYLGLWMWISPTSPRLRGIAPALTALGLGLSIQAEVFLAYHIFPLVIWMWVGRKNITKKQFVTFALLFIASVSTMILNEFKFGFKSLEGIKALAIGVEGNLAYAKSLGDYLILYLNQIGRIFAFNSYPGNIGYGGAFVLGLGIYSLIKKDKVGMFLATWLFSHLTVVTIGGTSTPFLMVGIGSAVSLIIAYYLSKFSKLVATIVLAILIFGNISMILKENPKGSTLFAIQKDMLLTKQLSLIDYTYQEAGWKTPSAGSGQAFSINSLTSPLWINIVWSYLYQWYGEKKYGYAPCFSGRDQVGQLMALSRCEIEKEIEKRDHFLILEPMGGIPTRYLDETLAQEDTVSKVVDEKSFGELRVQKRSSGW